MTPRDVLELNVLERTSDPDVAEVVGNVTQFWLEQHAEQLSPIMGVPPEMLMDYLWEMAAW